MSTWCLSSMLGWRIYKQNIMAYGEPLEVAKAVGSVTLYNSREEMVLSTVPIHGRAGGTFV